MVQQPPTQQPLTQRPPLDSERPDSKIDGNPQFDSEGRVTALDVSHLVIEDDTPVDNFESEKHQRLLVEPLYSAQALPAPFLAAANVGLFYQIVGEPIVPDVMLSLGVQTAADYSKRNNRSYFAWEFGKLPEVCIEIVSNREGDEVALSKKSQRKGKTLSKKELYAQIGVRYYVVFDPQQQLKEAMNQAFLRVWVLSGVDYREITPAEGITTLGQSVWLEGVGIGLTLWEGEFEEDVTRLWLRWCGQDGQVIPTGAEGQAIAQQQAEAAQQQAATAQQQAEAAQQQAEAAQQQTATAQQQAATAQQRAEAEQQRAKRLAERLKAMGIDPDEV